MNVFTIKDLENLSGIKAHTIRIWEQRYSFLNPKRTETNIRYYSSLELQTLLNVALLNRYGYKISLISRMTGEDIRKKIITLSQAEAQQERVVNELLSSMVDFQMDDFEKTLDDYIRVKGVEKTIQHIIFPFLERIGILWLTNHIQPAQEHLVSNIIRQKLIIGIAAITTRPRPGKQALLFLPEGEHHELALLFVQYLLKQNGIRVWYLGADTPLADVVFAEKIQTPDFLYIHLTSPAVNFNLSKYLVNLQQQLPGRNIIISGVFIQNYHKKTAPGILLKRSLKEVIDFVASV